MRIAMLSVHSSPLARLGGKEAGGMNVYVRELARECGQRGMPVDIFTRSQDPSDATIIPLSCGVRVINLHTGPAAPYDKNQIITYLPEFVNRVRCFADGQDIAYDIIHSHYWLSGEAGIRLRRSWGVPLVHMFHTLGAMKNSVARSIEETETSQRIAIERRLMREADTIVAATPLDRAQMVWHYGADAERISVIPCGVDLQRFQPRPQAAARARLGLHTNQHIVLCVGRMEPLKGMDSLIHSLAIVHQQHPSWRDTLQVLLIGGASEAQPEQWNTEQQRLAQLRTDLNVAHAVTFLGAQPQERLPDYYAAADIVTIPSHYESFGMVALEAMACGVPVIASDVGGLAITIEDGQSGLLVPPDAPDILADRLQQVLISTDQRATLSIGAHKRALSYGWDSIARRVGQLYVEQIKQRKASRAGGNRLAHVS